MARHAAEPRPPTSEQSRARSCRLPSPTASRSITGASRGIGHAAALALAKTGAHVVAVARTVGGLEELDDEIKGLGGSATLVPLDLNDYAGIDRLGARPA